MGTWVENGYGKEFWGIENSPGLRALAELVLDHWQGGRVLFLPNGLVVKPLQGDLEVGQRVLIGRFKGSVLLRNPNGGLFDLGNPGKMAPGDFWPGPKTTGLECAIQYDGSLVCSWYHPTTNGRTEISERVWGPDSQLARGFRKARPHDLGGRVRVTANGHVITNRQESNGTWRALYVGKIAVGSWHHRKSWIENGRP